MNSRSSLCSPLNSQRIKLEEVTTETPASLSSYRSNGMSNAEMKIVIEKLDTVQSTFDTQFKTMRERIFSLENELGAVKIITDMTTKKILTVVDKEDITELPKRKQLILDLSEYEFPLKTMEELQKFEAQLTASMAFRKIVMNVWRDKYKTLKQAVKAILSPAVFLEFGVSKFSEKERFLSLNTGDILKELFDENFQIELKSTFHAQRCVAKRNVDNVPVADPTTDAAAPSLFACQTCRKKFDDKLQLTAHIRQHFYTYECPDCEESIVGDTLYNYHLETAHQLNAKLINRPRLSCELCPGKLFMLKVNLDRHMEMVHDIKLERPFRCDICQQTFGTYVQIQMHIAGKHQRDHLKCDHCDTVFETMELLRRHQYQIDGSKHYKCDKCEKQFVRKTALRRHEANHIMRLFKCEICGKCLETDEQLSEHLDEEHSNDDKQFSCDLCAERFYLYPQLSKHMRDVHKEETLYEVLYVDENADENTLAEAEALAMAEAAGMEEIEAIEITHR